MKYLNFIYYEELDSTNEEAKRNIENINDFTLLLADLQTKGKGRNNREWFSPKGENLYFTIVFKPKIEIKFLTALPIIAGFSMLKLLENIIKNKKIAIKWPNDILIEDRKIAGILIENFKERIILGIGLNVNTERFPDFKTNIPTSLKIETNTTFDRLLILKNFFKIFYINYRLFEKEKKIPKKLLKEINEKLYLKNEHVTVKFKNSIESGKVMGINEMGALVLEDNILIYAGDVKKVRRGSK